VKTTHAAEDGCPPWSRSSQLRSNPLSEEEMNEEKRVGAIASGGGASARQGSPPPGDARDQPLPELLKQLSEQTATLVRKEMELAKAEMTVKGKRLGIGAGAFGGAGLFGLYALGALTAAVILALGLLVAGWLAALIVAAIYALIAGVAALVGKRKVQEGAPPVPKQAIDSTKEDVEWTKRRAKQTRS
jgi:putative superfamily III holin-X